MMPLLSNGMGSGMHPYALFLSSLDRAPMSHIQQAREGEMIMDKELFEDLFIRALKQQAHDIQPSDYGKTAERYYNEIIASGMSPVLAMMALVIWCDAKPDIPNVDDLIKIGSKHPSHRAN